RAAASCEASLYPRRAGWADRPARGPGLYSTQPAGGDTGAACLFLETGEGFLVVVELLFEAAELGERLLTIAVDKRPLRRIGAVHEIGRQRVDARLQGIRNRLVALELILDCLFALRPIRLIFED